MQFNIYNLPISFSELAASISSGTAHINVNPILSRLFLSLCIKIIFFFNIVYLKDFYF